MLKFSFKPNTGENSFVYMHTGSAVIGPESGGEKINRGELAELFEGDLVEIRSPSGNAGFLFLSAAPNNEPIVRGGPFVMNSKEEIRRAFEDYQNGTLY